MSTYDPLIEGRLRQAEERWKLLKFVQRGATLGTAVLVVLLLLGFAQAFAGLPAVFVALGLGAGVFAGLLGGVLLTVMILTTRQDRAGLARAWERAHAPLLDRLNTLVYLESVGERPWTESYARRIAAQARGVLAKASVPVPFPAARPLAHLLVFLLALTATCAFYQGYQPWREPFVPPPPAAVTPEPAMELPPPLAVDEEAVWGEVRITAPGADLAVTPAEPVPIQIEAASNRPLASVAWFTSVNEGDEQTHALPDPDEPLFAAYKATLSPGAMRLREWDVVTYYAKATTKTGESYKSDVYFVEVRPFRQDLLDATGGEQGIPYELFDELTGLIEQQQSVIRKTHRGLFPKDGRASLPENERVSLARSEDELARASDHLAAKFDAALRWLGVRGPEAKLTEAAAALGLAAAQLRDNDLEGAQSRERDALAKLIAARQRFQDVVSARPEAFRNLKEEKLTQQPDPSQMLKEVAEFRDEAEAAQDFVQNTLTEQRKIARTATPLKTPIAELGRKQEALRNSLDEFRKQHPSPFKDADKPFEEARRALKSSSDAMKKGGALAAGPKANTAAEKLKALAEAMTRPAHDRQLADAYRLKQELDAQIERFRRVEKEPDSLAPDDLKKETGHAMELAHQLRRVAEKPPTRDDFGPELRKAVEEKALNELKSRCEGLCQGEGREAKAGNAKAVREGLEKMARAFEKSAPRALASGAESPDPLKPGGQHAIDRGLAQLEALAGGDDGADGKAGSGEEAAGKEGSLGQRGGKGEEGKSNTGQVGIDAVSLSGPGRAGSGKGRVKLSPSHEKKLRAEAAANLTAGIRGKFGENDRTAALVRLIERDVRERPEPIDASVIGRLRQALEERQTEVSAGGDSKDSAKPKGTHLDPGRVAPAYRKAIEIYFEKLSERP